MAYIAVSHKTEQIVAEGECIVVTYNYRTSQKAPVPQEIVELARQLEKEAKERLAKDWGSGLRTEWMCCNNLKKGFYEKTDLECRRIIHCKLIEGK